MSDYVTRIKSSLATYTSGTGTGGTGGTGGTATPPPSGNLTPPNDAEIEVAMNALNSSIRASGDTGLGAPMAMAKSLVNYEVLMHRIGAIAQADRTAQMNEFMNVMGAAADVGQMVINACNMLKAQLGQLYDVLNVVADEENSDVIAEIQRMIQQMLINTNRIATSMSVEAMNHQFDSTMKAAKEMDEAADERLAAALVQGLTSIVMGVVSVGMGLVAAGKTYDASVASAKADAMPKGDGRPGAAMDQVAADAKASLAKQNAHIKAAAMHKSASIWTSNARSMNEFGQGFSTALASKWQMDAGKSDADQKRHDAASNMSGQSMQSANTLSQALKESAAKINDLQAQLGRLDADVLKKLFS